MVLGFWVGRLAWHRVCGVTIIIRIVESWETSDLGLSYCVLQDPRLKRGRGIRPMSRSPVGDECSQGQRFQVQLSCRSSDSCLALFQGPEKYK